MKFLLSKITISAEEQVKLLVIADYLGYKYIYQEDEQGRAKRALFETEENDIAYIQKDNFNRLFIVWKSTENLQRIEPLFDIVSNLNKYQIIPKVWDSVKVALGIFSMTKTVIDPSNLDYLLCKRQ